MDGTVYLILKTTKTKSLYLKKVYLLILNTAMTTIPFVSKTEHGYVKKKTTLSGPLHNSDTLHTYDAIRNQIWLVVNFVETDLVVKYRGKIGSIYSRYITKKLLFQIDKFGSKIVPF